MNRQITKKSKKAALPVYDHFRSVSAKSAAFTLPYDRHHPPYMMKIVFDCIQRSLSRRMATAGLLRVDQRLLFCCPPQPRQMACFHWICDSSPATGLPHTASKNLIKPEDTSWPANVLCLSRRVSQSTNNKRIDMRAHWWQLINSTWTQLFIQIYSAKDEICIIRNLWRKLLHQHSNSILAMQNKMLNLQLVVIHTGACQILYFGCCLSNRTWMRW